MWGLKKYISEWWLLSADDLFLLRRKVLRFLSGYLYGIKVSEIAGLISSANLYADYFQQMFYLEFWWLKVSYRILVLSRENKVSEIVEHPWYMEIQGETLRKELPMRKQPPLHELNY